MTQRSLKAHTVIIQHGERIWELPPADSYPEYNGPDPIRGWYSNLINKVMPEMGERYMGMMIKAGFSVPQWFRAIRDTGLIVAFKDEGATDAKA